MLLAVFNALGGFASILPALALAFAAGAAALLVLFWLGLTTLTLSFAAVERAYAVRGRNGTFADFAATLGERLAARRE